MFLYRVDINNKIITFQLEVRRLRMYQGFQNEVFEKALILKAFPAFAEMVNLKVLS